MSLCDPLLPVAKLWPVGRFSDYSSRPLDQVFGKFAALRAWGQILFCVSSGMAQALVLFQRESSSLGGDREFTPIRKGQTLDRPPTTPEAYLTELDAYIAKAAPCLPRRMRLAPSPRKGKL